MTRIVRWLALAVIVTALFASLYLVMQQVERHGADDAPVRLASQLASQSAGSRDSSSGLVSVDLARSDATFFVIYDAANRPVSGTGRLDGALPVIPAGVLDQARRKGTNHVTWQIADGRRFATVERRSGDSVVLGAQSLAPTESRIDQIGLLILVAWACVMALVVIAFLVERAVTYPAASDATTARSAS
ncbi:MAG: hypothetical protein ABIO06_02095 [Pseudolysinimonas sp.]